MKKKLLMLFMGTFLLVSHAMAQQITVSGKVTSSEDGGIVPGASVLIKGTKTATQTNSSGVYTIQTKAGDILVFSYIGLLPQERPVGGSSIINVVLSADSKGLNEVVVTAYGIERDSKSLGYSTPKVSGDEVSQTQRESFFSGLQGRVPGLSINPTSGDPGASSQIVLRGFVSVSGDNSPLIVVDGLPIDNSIINQTNDLIGGAPNRNSDYSNRAGDINPADIESYTILKGPEATALYGNLGASGAILITTKKAKAGKGSINYSTNFNVSSVVNMPEVQTKYNQGLNGIYASNTTVYGGPVYPEGTKLYNNFDAFFQNAISQQQNLSFEGGTEKYTYRWSNQYATFNGTVPNTNLDKFSSRLTAEGEIAPWLKLTTFFNYINSKNVKPTKGVSGYLSTLLRFPPRYDINYWQDELGNRVLRVADIYSEFDNPFWTAYKNTSTDETNRFMMNNTFRIRPTKWLNINVTMAADVSNTAGLQAFNGQSYAGSGSADDPALGRITTYDRKTRILNGSVVASANHKIGNFSTTFVLGGNIGDNYINTNSIYGEKMYDPNFYSINNTLPTTQRARNSINNYRTVGAFAQAVLGYNSLVYLTLSGRVDGASRLMPNDPYFAYPSASFAFNFTDLKYFKEIDWITGGKLRASVGITGKEPWRTYAVLTNLTPRTSSGGGFSYDYNGGNRKLKPETTINWETGFDLKMFKDRLSLDFTYYRLLSKDQIIQPRISYATGYVLRMLNGGEVRNQGVEIQVMGTPIQRKDFGWDATFNFALNRGKVISIADELPELYDSDTWVLGGLRSAVFPGASMTAIGGIRFDRNNNGDILINPATGLPYTTGENYEVIGDRQPKFTFGITNNIRLKSFNLSFLWDFRIGGDIVNGTEYVNYTRGISTKTLDREEPRVVKGVLKDGLENTNNPTPNAIAVTPYLNSLYYTTNVSAEMFVEKNINTIRLRDISLSYVIPKTVFKRLPFLQSASVFVTLTDVVLFTNYSGMDPESNSNNASLGGAGGMGIDYYNMGRPLTANFGLKLKL
ncbi:SusC/RagA family TonB-linked outer membrane protein [Pedobacter heparinus]|uniref:TonB-dependent receptor plug n=1 Tax=Pedobacter heparinus (strain ATCC 13125 / DSM 2366 / CIP 104194 / JCM 7457 / NBRC 12017 / NCIMB 9290 / NRRL B-14731 / HIM 762-3) TaxID=485917 RepID=C6XWN3_PEDHD|nr:SusC/RagA family TonB-linked outer membrane protein [Pedobacter heparinus]ACU06322.1 TonB-dependent receptor plug [Pedobacter heparinus DSM 2366]